MLKNLIVVLILLMSGSVFAETQAQAHAPDFLYFECVLPSDRTLFRALRNLCDDEATALGYHIGIYRPYNEIQDGLTIDCKEIDPLIFTCLGAPHKEAGCTPPDCG